MLLSLMLLLLMLLLLLLLGYHQGWGVFARNAREHSTLVRRRRNLSMGNDHSSYLIGQRPIRVTSPVECILMLAALDSLLAPPPGPVQSQQQQPECEDGSDGAMVWMHSAMDYEEFEEMVCNLQSDGPQEATTVQKLSVIVIHNALGEGVHWHCNGCQVRVHVSTNTRCLHLYLLFVWAYGPWSERACVRAHHRESVRDQCMCSRSAAAGGRRSTTRFAEGWRVQAGQLSARQAPAEPEPP